MNALNAISLSVGLWVGIWCFATLGYLEPKVMTWITFLTWASFYAAGGGKAGLVKAIASAFAGTLISAAIVWLNGQLGGGVQGVGLLIFSLLLAVLGWALCQLSKVDLFSFIPGAFIGAASFFGAGAPLDGKLGWVLVSIVCGAVMRLISERMGQAMTAKAPA
ncbi:DUF1097 domain-containing protein [Methylibium sp.]|uniref:DUF1097 domain-containing protein n=1 Tax=Methylibium sp. TaxID=2067992 RepID=UPI00333F4DCE